MIRLSNSASIPAHYINRHITVTGPTGTGKTVTVKRLIRSIVTNGTPVFAPDVKGDLGPANVRPRIPAWMFGPDLLARAFDLTEVQAGVLEIAFAWADEMAYPLDGLDDLRSIIFAMWNSPDSVAHLGHVTRASIGTIQRALLRLDKQGASTLFGPCNFDTADLIDNPALHILDASRLYHSPRLYGALLMFIMQDIARRLPESGDLDRPRLVLVFDEAHTIFNEISPALLRTIEATARLIRSKGVGLVWASQSPEDIPQIIRQQCATTIKHERQLGVGRCAFTTLDAYGRPTIERIITPDMASLHGLPASPTRFQPPALAQVQDPLPLWLAVLGWTIILTIAVGIYLATR